MWWFFNVCYFLNSLFCSKKKLILSGFFYPFIPTKKVPTHIPIHKKNALLSREGELTEAFFGLKQKNIHLWRFLDLIIFSWRALPPFSHNGLLFPPVLSVKNRNVNFLRKYSLSIANYDNGPPFNPFFSVKKNDSLQIILAILNKNTIFSYHSWRFFLFCRIFFALNGLIWTFSAPR